MTIIDNIMALADAYATQRQHSHYKHETDARQALRTAIEAALKDEREACAQLCTPNFIGEYPVGSGRDDRYDLAMADCAAAIRGRST
jgi:hypothetical protein